VATNDQSFRQRNSIEPNMKIIITSVLLFVVCYFNAQQQEKTIVSKSDVRVINSQTATFHVDSSMLAKKNQPQIDSKKTVAYYDEYIKAIEIKIAYIKADANLTSEAEKNGWFIQMDELLKTAKIERAELLKSN
jgi:hypothetical protein